MRLPPSLARLVEELRKLPGVGEKTASRLAFHLLDAPPERSASLAGALVALRERVRPCSRCGNLCEEELCPLCSDPSRDQGVLCVVETARDLIALETTGQFRGLYHVLRGALSPMRGVGPEELAMGELVERLQGPGSAVREVILATDLDVEGEATASYLATLLRPLPLRVTRLARGLPLGGSLEHADGVTLGLALEGRREF